MLDYLSIRFAYHLPEVGSNLPQKRGGRLRRGKSARIFTYKMSEKEHIVC